VGSGSITGLALAEGCASAYCGLDETQRAGGLIDRSVRATVGPSARKGQADPQSELVSPGVDEPEIVKECAREVGQYLRAGGLILIAVLILIERKRIDGLDLESTDTGGLHLLHLAEQFRLGDGGAKPPPPHHQSRVVWRRLESRFK